MHTTGAALVAAALSAALTTTSLIAFDAQNAHKVDGKHAVSASTGNNARKGKLVATSNASGKLPNNIITEAPDAARLAGKLPQSYRTISLAPRAGSLSESAAYSGVSVRLAGTGTSASAWSWVLPPSYPGWPEEIHADIVFYTSAVAGCSIVLQQFSGYGPGPDGSTYTGQWNTPGDAPIQIPAGSGTYHRARLTFVPAADLPPAPGMMMIFSLRRTADEPGDNCGNADVYAIQIGY